MGKFLSLILSFIMIVENIPLFWVPTLVVDASKTREEVSTKATGFLYGVSEPGVPSDNMTDSLDISSVSQKVIGGLQHPTGDADRVSAQLSECDYRVVYLQDAFDTWYYCHGEIAEMRKNGTYNWKEYITGKYFPVVEEKVKELQTKPYSDSLVYCIYNECDNGIWFGTDANDGSGNGVYDEKGRDNFFEGWKMTYDLVKSIAPDVLIGGPGFFDYNTEKITDFLTFAVNNDCVPEIMIYHELNPWSAVDWETHYEDYRKIEKSLGISERTIIVTEYGTMEECGNPAAMFHYIYAIENTGTYGNMAFWRLANNLNDTCSDHNTPNSNWWLYRKYAGLDGLKLETEVTRLKDRHLHDGDWRRYYKGIAVLNDEKDEISIIAMGSKNKRAVKITNLAETNLGSKLDVKIECVYYNGLNSPVYEPVVIREFTKKAGKELSFNIPGTDTDAVYFITVSKSDGETKTVRNTNLPVRYEFEEGKLLGDAYTYDSAYATTGAEQGMVGGMEKEGDGVRIKVEIPKSGTYRFDVVYGKHNDSGVPAERDFSTVNFTVDKATQQIKLPNTIKSEYTNLYPITLDLSAGIHTLEFTHEDGTYVLDSVLVYEEKQSENIYLLPDGEKNKDFLAVAPYDGYYEVAINEKTAASADGIETSLKDGSLLYLQRGLNEIKLETENSAFALKKAESESLLNLGAKDLILSDGASVKEDKYGNFVTDNISCDGGKAQFTVNAKEKGDYRVTVTYSNNSEGGVHSYNVDLIERYLTLETKGEKQQVFFRNTFSDYNFNTVTFKLSLEEGENTVTLSNDGSYRFNNMKTYAPAVKNITVNEIVK